MPDSNVRVIHQSLPTPNPSPVANGNPGPQPLTTQHALRHQASYDEGSEEGGYGTTDDEPTIRPDHSSEGSSIHTASSATTSQATTPATSPTRRARWSTGSHRGIAGAIDHRLHEENMQLGDGDDDDADTDGEGDDTDDEDVYRERRLSAPTARPPRSNFASSGQDTQMASP